MRTTHCRRHNRWLKNRIVTARLVGVDRSDPQPRAGAGPLFTDAKGPEVPERRFKAAAARLSQVSTDWDCPDFG
jgi:hypothetical protein